MWKVSWFLRDFGYDSELLGKNEIDEKALIDLWGVVKRPKRIKVRAQSGVRNFYGSMLFAVRLPTATCRARYRNPGAGCWWRYPHWAQVQVYERPIPLWPEQLRPGWQSQISTNYQTPLNEEASASGPADEGARLGDDYRGCRPVPHAPFYQPHQVPEWRCYAVNSVRQETVWFAPEVGRWVARESMGSYYIEDSL